MNNNWAVATAGGPFYYLRIYINPVAGIWLLLNYYFILK